MATQKRANDKYVPPKIGFKIEDQKLLESQTFPRSKKLKGEGVDTPLTEEQELEYIKCATDPLYFAKTYYKITSIDEGFVTFDPFPYQEELIEAFHEHRFVIDLQCRQSGKCVSHDTKIRIRNKDTLEESVVSIGGFHNMVMEDAKIKSTLSPIAKFVIGECHGSRF